MEDPFSDRSHSPTLAAEDRANLPDLFLRFPLRHSVRGRLPFDVRRPRCSHGGGTVPVYLSSKRTCLPQIALHATRNAAAPLHRRIVEGADRRSTSFEDWKEKMASIRTMLVALLLGLFSFAHAQRNTQISYTGPGCARVAPSGGIKDVKCTPGDEEVELEWGRPDNGACVDYYEVEGTVARQRGAQDSGTRPDGNSLVVKGLTNGEKYTFKITAVLRDLGSTSSSVSCTPKKKDQPKTTPGPVQNLYGVPGDKKVTLLFYPPEESGSCPITGYEVEARDLTGELKKLTPRALGLRGGFSTRVRVPVEDLINCRLYTFTVRATNCRGAGASSTTFSIPRSSFSECWRSSDDCTDEKPPGEYNCQQQLEWGKCSEAWMRTENYCELTCGRCSLEEPTTETKCEDTPVPNSGYSCEQHKSWGRCDQQWFKDGGYCQNTCGACGGPAQAPAGISSSPLPTARSP